MQSTAAGAVRLFRKTGASDFSYSTAEDGEVVEVAIGVPTALSRNASIAMQFAVQVKADHTGDIRNTAHSQYNDGVAPAASPSNTVVIAASPTQGQSRIGVAKAASTPRMNRGSDGQFDGTATVTFDVNLRNYGITALHGVQATDVLEGLEATRFGALTSAKVPGPNQYAVVSGTLAIVGSQGKGAVGTVAAINAAFNGTASAQELLAPGAVLPVGGQFTVRFDVRFKVAAHAGQAGPLLNTVRAQAALAVAPTNGDAVNRARASSGPMQSNLAQWTVRVTGGVFSDDAFLFGKVYMDCRRDGRQQGADEIGVPGVRLYMEDGTHVITDVEGKWSLYGLKPVTHVLRLDATTLPVGATLEALDNRNAGRPDSRFVDLKKGEFHKANFVIANCDAPGVMNDVIARREAIAAVPDTEAEAQVRMRLDPEGRVVPVGDRRGLPASGEVRGGGNTGTTQTSSAPLIAMPAAPASLSSFIGGASGGQGSTLGAATGGGAAAADGASPAGSLFTGMRLSRGMVQPTAASPLLPQAAPSPIDLEALLPRIESNALGFIELRDGDTVPSTSLNVRVKGEVGMALRLNVNGQAVEARRVGKKTEQAHRQIAAWEYIGVVLQPGVNRLTLEAADPFGNTRGTAHQISVTAPDKLGAIHVDVPASAQADLRTPVVVKVRLTDAAGVPVTARTQLTLDTDRGRWLDEDLNPAEPGTQVFMDGGAAAFRLLPPGEPGDARLRVTAASFVKEARLALLPELRPMIGVGIVEGVLDLTKRGSVPLGAMPAGAAFEAELSGLSDEGSDRRASARGAFFFKGAVKGEYLLTAAFDSDKTRKDRLFRDIRPDEFYPVYGDSSVKGFDAQSTQKLYVRIDKNRSYLLYGDFNTASSTEVRSLSQVSRSLTGLKHVYDDGEVRATTFASRTAQTQQIEEFRAVGTSGPYYLSAKGGEFVENSEQVEIVVRDRNQPDLVLQRSTVTRFVDYTVEPLTRRLLFTRPIASVDPNLNPQSIRVTYEVDAGGPKFTVAGADVQLKVAKNLQVGVVAAIDENPENRRKLGALTAVARLGDKTTVAGEWVQTESDRNGKGSGARVELRHQGEDLAVAALASKTSTGFDNPGASFSAGRTEASARAEYRLDAATALRGEMLYGQDALRDGSRRGIMASVQRKLGEQLVGEFGLRHGHNGAGLGSGSGFDYGQISTYSSNLGSGVASNNVTALGAAANAGTQANANDEDLTTVRARLSAQVPGVPQANVFVEGEQDVRKSDRHTLAIGGNYAITDKTRLYGRYELVSSLYGPYELNAGQSNNVGIVGIESAYMEGGRVYSEYRLADSLDGRAAQAATGLRNTFKVDDHWRLTGGVEHTRQIGGLRNSGNNGTGQVSGLTGDSTAITGGVEYLDARIKASGILEGRRAGELNFGDVPFNRFGADSVRTGSPGSSVSHAHTFVAQTGGAVSFGAASAVAAPPIDGWSARIYSDPGCTGTLQGGAAVLYPPPVPTTVTAGQNLCVVVQEFIPANAQAGYTDRRMVEASFVFTNASSALSASYFVDDTTTVSSTALELKKEVRNLTKNGDFGLNNEARSGEVLEYRITYSNNGVTPIRRPHGERHDTGLHELCRLAGRHDAGHADRVHEAHTGEPVACASGALRERTSDRRNGRHELEVQRATRARRYGRRPLQGDGELTACVPGGAQAMCRPISSGPSWPGRAGNDRRRGDRLHGRDHGSGRRDVPHGAQRGANRLRASASHRRRGSIHPGHTHSRGEPPRSSPGAMRRRGRSTANGRAPRPARCAVSARAHSAVRAARSGSGRAR